ncbi:2-dehydro-3-deoxygluconokinase [Robertmurraya siralis]|uniref:2-dehydro-3-deoxygluconokinase n=1 Tax=Robertmurraya siralis TaxID=77777 RepID=A0A919WJW2_9BACI|nr:sugar kinase [Robertmurraya siralis]GIN63390.1 2-dehydro-3-deoxygluconokinase [Robertmurraya siralis]
MNKIVTFGEILLRLSTNIGERLFQTDHINTHFGGAEANVAVSLSKFGHDVYFVSKVPKNPLGSAVERHMRLHGVHTDFLLKGGDRLGTYFVESGVGPRSAQVTYDRKYSSFSQLTLEEVDFERIFSGTSLYHVTGITPALAPSMKEIVLYSLKKAKEFGITTSFDFNYRGKLWSQQEAAETFKTFLPYIDICSCGELDALYLLGIEQADDSLEKNEKLAYYYEKIQLMYPNIRWMSSTFRDVISASSNTLQGNIYVDGILYQSKVYPIDHIVDRVGGGDAFTAGILHGIIRKKSPDEIVTFATAASVLKHTIHGDCNVFTEEEIQAFSNSIPGKIVR